MPDQAPPSEVGPTGAQVALSSPGPAGGVQATVTSLAASLRGLRDVCAVRRQVTITAWRRTR
jgi:hypothetical protein